jgi:hypothetical protein
VGGVVGGGACADGQTGIGLGHRWRADQQKEEYKFSHYFCLPIPSTKPFLSPKDSVVHFADVIVSSFRSIGSAVAAWGSLHDARHSDDLVVFGTVSSSG